MRLSVAIIDCETPDVLAGCVRALDQLESRERVDVTIVRQRPGESTRDVRARAVRDLQNSCQVFLNARYRVSKTWARAILDAHASGAAVVGGCVAYPEDRRSSSDARRSIYLWEYAHTAPPLPDGQVRPEQARQFPGGNTSYRSDVLQTWNIAQYRNEMELHGALASAGLRVHRIPAALAVYDPPSVYSYISEMYRLARRFSGSKGGTIKDRTAQALIRAFLLPSWLFARGVSRVWERPRYRSWLIASSPWFLLFSLVQTAGELAGYVSPATQPIASTALSGEMAP